MAISYKPMWHTLVDKNMIKADLGRKAKITNNIIARMSKDSYIDMSSIEKICLALEITPNDIFEVVKD